MSKPAPPTIPPPAAPLPPGDGWVRTAELRPLLTALTALRDGNFGIRLDAAADGVTGELAAVFNQVVARNDQLTGELRRVRGEVVRHGRLDERLDPSPGAGAWAVAVQSVNTLMDRLVQPITEMTRVLEAVAGGDLTPRADLGGAGHPLRGDLRRTANTVNRMCDQLELFTVEVAQVAREVGIDGRLGGRARLEGLSGRWRDVTEAVNTMGGRLTAQVRDIAAVTTAVANGDLSR
jgi:HAMP domain-containing protein